MKTRQRDALGAARRGLPASLRRTLSGLTETQVAAQPITQPKETTALVDDRLFLAHNVGQGLVPSKPEHVDTDGNDDILFHFAAFVPKLEKDLRVTL